jgi:hypothetical protein
VAGLRVARANIVIHMSVLQAGPSGFEHAGVMKGLCVASAVSTAVLWYLQDRGMTASALRKPLRLVLQHLAFRSSYEGFLCLGLLYNFRLLERRYGSAKFGSFMVLAELFSQAARLLLQRGLPVRLRSLRSWAPSPLSLATACIFPLLMDLAPR